MKYINFRLFCECNVMNSKYNDFLLKFLKTEWRTSTQLGCRLFDKNEEKIFNDLVADWKKMSDLSKNKWKFVAIEPIVF